MVKLFRVPVIPVKPVNAYPLFKVRENVVSLIVPVPVSAPVKFIVPTTFGLDPIGKLQPLLTVVILPTEAVKLTALNVALLQIIVAPIVVALPSKLIVPPFALKVVPPEIVKLLPVVHVPLGAVKVPELKVNC